MDLKLLSKFSWALVLMLLACTSLYAQERKVTGKVVDKQDGMPIPGVNVSVKGKPSNVSTNADGVFTIQIASDEDALVFSYIGYTRQTIPVGKLSVVNVSLASDNKDLNEVVVVGYGTQKKVHLTGSVVAIDTKEIEDLPATNIGAALAGRLLGVGISGGISRPGSKAAITVRSPVQSFGKDAGSPQPLYVIDGIIQVTGQNQPDNTIFNNLDPSEVESISVLKDASAAIYGVKGANGVILVTTKKGKSGAPRISYNGSYAINDEAYRTKMMSAYEFGQYMNIMNGPNGADAPTDNSSYVNKVFSQDELDYFKTINFDRLEKAWSSSYNMRHAVNISGGSDRATYFAGAAYSKQNGNLATLDYNKWNFRAGADVNVLANLKVGLQVSGNTDNLIKTFNKVSGEGQEDDYKNLLLAPRYVPEYVNGLPVKLPGTTNDLSRYHFGEIERLNNLATTKGKTFTVNANIEYKVPFVTGLSARASFGRNMQSSMGSQIGTKYDVYEFSGRLGEHQHIYEGATGPKALSVSNGNRLYYSNINSTSTQTNFILNYERSFGKHFISALGSVERGEAENDQQDTWRNDPIPSTNGQFNTAFGSFEGKTARNESGTLGYIGRVNYRYGEKYLAEFLFRTDASTKFAPENYWGKFYSGSLGWVISEEDFFKVKGIDFLKARYSIGVLGNDQIGAWLWRQRYTFQDGKGGVFGGNGAASTGLKMEASPNRDATWSQELKNNIGLDARFLNNRLSATVEGFYNIGTDILIERTALVPVTVGGSVASENWGKANYFGYELELGWNDKIGKDFNYGISTRFSWYDDKIKRMNFNDTEIMYPWNAQPNKSSDNGVWGYELLGMFKTQDEVANYIQQYNITQVHEVSADQLRPGALYFKDVRGPLQADGTFAAPDGIIDENDQVQLAKRKDNHYGYGITLKAGYKGFSFDAVLAGSFGGWSEIGETKKLNNDIPRNFTSLPAIWGNIYDPVINPTGTMPNPNWEQFNSKTSDFWRVSSFRMRLTSFNINYSIPKKFLEAVNVSNARIYFSGMNPFNLFNPYSYKDPTAAWDSYPNLKTYSFGLNLTL